MDKSNHTQAHQNGPQVAGTGVSRRRLVRAGLTAAPVVAALKSNTVLAGAHTCIRPSSFSSLTAAQMKVSRGRTFNTEYRCDSPDSWRTKQSRLPTDFKTKTLFLSTTTGFMTNPGVAYTGLSLQQVLDLSGSQNNAILARYVVAAYLSAMAFNDDSRAVLLTKAQCRAIWNGQGMWAPFSGATWSLEQTLGYFDKVFGPKFL